MKLLKKYFNRVNEDDVRLIFNKFLNRDPEDGEIAKKLIKSKIQIIDLCLSVSNSKEFIKKIMDTKFIKEKMKTINEDNKIKNLLNNCVNLQEDYKTIIIKLINYNLNQKKTLKTKKEKNYFNNKITNNKFIDLFKMHYYNKLGKRKDDFLKLITLMINKNIKNLVETGSIRKEDNFQGDGCSTLIFSDYSKFNNARFTSIDIDPNCGDIIKKLKLNVNFVNQNSLIYLHNRKEDIDFIYLDSFDYEKNLEHESSLHHLFELMAILPKLKSGSIIAVDDNYSKQGNGKGRYIKEYFSSLGIKPMLDGYMLIYILE
jgi:hypothetical protein